jgi:EpsI family protein
LPVNPDAVRRARHAVLLAAIGILSLQGLVAFSLSLTEYVPSPPALAKFPGEISQWRAAGDVPMDPAAYDMLSPDDYLNRIYRNQGQQTDLSLFIAYYKSQRRAKGAHDPKVCLPGSGWNPVSSGVIQISDGQTSMTANHLVISKDSATDIVVYWYQMQHGSLTGVEGLHFSRLLEAFGENRTDMALVRIVVPVENGSVSNANQYALDFAAAAFPSIMRQFPPRTPSK